MSAVVRQIRRFPPALLLLVVACSLAACSPPEAPTPSPRPVRVETVSPAPAAPGRRYSAVLQPERQAFVAFKVGGRLVALAQRRDDTGKPRDLQPGDRVKKGEVLARLEAGEYSDRQAQGRAQVEEAESGLDKARRDLERATRLYAETSLTRPELDAATAAATAAEARLAAARAGLAATSVPLADTVLTAPWNGVVSERRAALGELAVPGATGFGLADLEQVEAVFGVPAAVVGRLTLGDRLEVTLEGEARPRAARVSAIAPLADPTSRVFAVEARLDNHTPELKPGTIVTVEIPSQDPAASQPDRPVVPFAAVFAAPQGGYAVLVVSEEAGRALARLRPVQLGEVVGSTVEITDGLELGERVVASAPTLLADGEAVRIVP